jgi:hypothetical protein
MVAYMLADGLPEGVVARVMGWPHSAVVAVRKGILLRNKRRRRVEVVRLRNRAKLAADWARLRSAA